MRSPGAGKEGAQPSPEFKPGFQRWAFRRSGRPGRPASSPRRALRAVGSPGAGAQQPHVAAPAQASGLLAGEPLRPQAPGPARPRAPRWMVFGNKVLMANLVFILKLLTMIFLGEEGSGCAHARVGFEQRLCQMVRSPRCAHHGAHQLRPPGTRAGAAPSQPPQPHRPQRGGGGRGKEKKGGKGHRRRGRGRGARSRKFPAENSTEGGGESPLQFPPPPPHPPIIWKLLPTSPGTSDSLLHFQADKALSRGNPASLWEEGTVPGSHCPPASLDPAPNRGVTPGQRGRPGRRAGSGHHQLFLPRARLVLGWSPAFVSDLFFIL